MAIKSISIKKGFLKSVISFMDTPLSPADSRARNRVITTLAKAVSEIDKDRDDLLKQHCEKDENDNPKTIEEGTKYDITPENLGVVNNEMIKIVNEDFIIDILPSNIEDLKIAYKALQNTENKLTIQEGVLYEEILKKFEVVNEKNE